MILPAVKEIIEGLARHPSFEKILAAARSPKAEKLQLSGLYRTAQAIYAVLLHDRTQRPVVIVVSSSTEADLLCESALAFFDLLGLSADRGLPLVLPGLDVTPYDGLSPHADVAEKRGIGLWRAAERSVSVAVVPVASLLLKTAPVEFYRNLTWKIEIGDEFYLEDLESGLVSAGYSRHEPVDMAGQYSIRGGIIDVYSPEAMRPVRIEMLGDEVESIREFDPETQKSVQIAEQAVLLPLTEYPMPVQTAAADDAEAELLGPGWEFEARPGAQRTKSLWDLLDRPIAVWAEAASLESEAERLWNRLADAWNRGGDGRPKPEQFYFSLKEMKDRAGEFCQIELDQLGLAGGAPLHISTQPAPRFNGNIELAMRELQAQVKNGSRALIAVGSLGDVERLADVFNEYEISFQLGLKDPSKAASPYLEEKAYLAGPVASTVLVQAPLREGVAFPQSRVAIYGTEDLFGASELVARPAKHKSAVSTFLPDLEDLKEGDLVVHAEHGIGRYLGLKEMSHGSRQEDFMLLEYADRARLYVPLSRLDLVQKFHGGGGAQPPLDRMGGQTWKRTKSRVKTRLLDMAEELLKLYAARKLATGFVYSPDSNWQQEFEDAFAFAETPDQLQTIKDIKRDMESPQPMDRLVCGDVGFGKTEVAMRAAFKALGDGKQVAVLVPTTVLAFQHFETIRQRFAAFPVEIEMLTRFRNTRQQKEIVERLAVAKIDIVIGTHRLLSKDVTFADLGLLIVDEEQRFGVRHKERVKQFKKNVDVLTLTATPIPRTLHMSFVGLRDVSIIQTPPKDRLSIQTVVAPYSDQVVKTALRRELERGGQTYFIHNRVESIWKVASHLQELVPSARIGVGHGQLPEKQLEDVMLKFMSHEYDVLVSTTIVENGLDIPLANTILMNNADHYGLAELYQLRGRVGRSNRRAYAYLLVAEDKELSAVARKRLAALKEFSELGSGFKIAALDLELRGAGNLLGSQQHGQIAAVGFETYCRLLDETVRGLQGEDVEPRARASLKLQLDIHIPPGYIADETQRLQAYKRLAEIRNETGRSEAAAELKDRYGPIPLAVRNLMGYAVLKTEAEEIGVASIERRGQRLSMRFRENSKIEPERLMEFVSSTPGVTFSPNGELEWVLADPPGPKWLATARGLLGKLVA